jgi:ubiquitin-protein ligase
MRTTYKFLRFQDPKVRFSSDWIHFCYVYNITSICLNTFHLTRHYKMCLTADKPFISVKAYVHLVYECNLSTGPNN